jgi:hypothetical protein
MIVEALENSARLNGPWLQAWNDTNAASITSARVAFGQLELAALTSRFMTQRFRAYADYDGRIDPLVRRLDQLTEQYGEDYARQLRQIYSAWSDLLYADRAASQAMPLQGMTPPPRGAELRDEPSNGRGDPERGKKRGERRPENAAH